MNLSKKNLTRIHSAGSGIPGREIFDLPEKILQFGTGVLLRALPDYFVDKANRQGIFNGRIVIVKSTQTGDSDAFNQQDSLYTLSIRGLEKGVAVDEHIICSAISRVLSAAHEWDEILACASNEMLQVIISNTTEVGIQLLQESIFQKPPVSFPAKLLAFLYRRFKVFHGSLTSGMVIIPTELITDNGKKLKAILIELAKLNELEPPFMEWLDLHNRFCSSLVDRIVPGKPDPSAKRQLEQKWGYEDELMSVCELYALWAIEGDESIRNILTFYMAGEGVIIAPDITRYRELKLRMLNATHTLSSGLAFLCRFHTVKDAMEDGMFSTYVQNLMMKEIGLAIPCDLKEAEIREYGRKVLDRFRNPFLQHHWLNITMQYSSKMAMRVVPVLNKYYEQFNKPPELISAGFAAFILFMRPVKKESDKYYGIFEDRHYLINDDRAAYFFTLWQKINLDDLVRSLLANTEIWHSDLNRLEGFGEKVVIQLGFLIKSGPMEVLKDL